MNADLERFLLGWGVLLLLVFGCVFAQALDDLIHAKRKGKSEQEK